MLKKILVTGANGFVGQHLARELSDHGYSVIGLGGHNLPDPDKKIFPSYTSLDLLDVKAVNEVNLKDIDGVIHLSGLAAVGPSYDEPMKYITTNVGIELNLFEAALRQKAFPRFLIISSGSLYNPTSKLPLRETSPTAPSSPYALSKLGQESLAQYYHSRGFEYVIARPFNHIGPGQRPGYIVPDLALQVVSAKKAGKDTIKVGNLKAKRDYSDVRDIVRAYRLLLEKGKSAQIYNICSGKSLSGQEILSELMVIAGVNLKPIVDNTKLRPVDIPDIYGSHNKLSRDTGWSPQVTITQSLVDVVNSI